MATVLTDANRRAGGFLVSELPKTGSRSTATLKSGENLSAGAVLQKEDSTGKYIQYDAGNSNIDDGPGAVAILFDAVDASDGDLDCVVIDKDAEVQGDELLWADDQDTSDQAAGVQALLSVGIKCRYEDVV